jgi:hypothetical protein
MLYNVQYVQCNVLCSRPTENVSTGTGRRKKFSKQKILLAFPNRKPKKFNFDFEVSAYSRVRRYFVFEKNYPSLNIVKCEHEHVFKITNHVWKNNYSMFGLAGHAFVHVVIEIVMSIKSLMALHIRWLLYGEFYAQSTYIYRVPQCMSPRRNRDSPTPSLASECAPPPGPKRGGTFACGWGIGGVPIPTTGKKLSTLSLPTLWFYES